jgi:hypothetical protein
MLPYGSHCSCAMCSRMLAIEGRHMTKADLLAIIKKLLRADVSLDFLLRLDEDDFRTLIVCIREMKSQERQAW